MGPEAGGPKEKPWRLAAIILASTLLGLLLVGSALLWQRRELSWLFSPEGPEPGGVRKPPAKATVDRPAGAAENPPQESPGERVLSLDGITWRPLQGELVLQPPVKATLGRLEADLLEAVKDLKDGCGIYPVAADKITFALLPKRDCLFTEAFSLSPSEGGVFVELPVEPLVLRWWTTRECLSAAVVAAVLTQESPAYAQAPPWLRYGLALHLSGFGEAWQRRAVLESEKPPQLLVRPLAEAGEQAWADGYWAMRAFESRAGDTGLKAWVKGLRDGALWDEALQAASGESAAAFEERYRAWASSHLRDRCANRQVLLDAVALLRQRKEAQALPALAGFVEEQPLDFYGGNARYFLNYALYREGKYEEAIEGFTDLLNNAPASTSWQGKAHYFLGRCYQFSGYMPLAVNEFRLASLEPDNPLLVKLAQQRLKEVE